MHTANCRAKESGWCHLPAAKTLQDAIAIFRSALRDLGVSPSVERSQITANLQKAYEESGDLKRLSAEKRTACRVEIALSHSKLI
jgi:hypothetical protein